MLCNNCILILIFILMPIAVSIDSNWWSSLKSNNAKDTKTVLVTIVDRVEALEEYKLALETVNCYANLQQYAHKVLILDNSELSTVVYIMAFMYRRHCILSHFMSLNSQYILVVFLDADIGVVNPNHTIDEYLLRDDTFKLDIPYMIFYNRLFVHEIAAGSYIALNVEYSQQFLHYWANLSYVEPSNYRGTDNGAIHLVFMEMFTPTAETKQKCTRYRNESTTYPGLFKFEACVRHHFGLNETRYSAYGRNNGNMGKVIGFVAMAQFGKSWCRDAGLTESRFSSGDFMFHGWKQSLMDIPQLNNKAFEWKYPFAKELFEAKEFDLQKCLGGSMEPWVPKEGLFVEEAKIDKELGVWIKKVNDGYEEQLKILVRKFL